MTTPRSRSAALWADHAELAERCLRHPFVQGIASGQLPREVFVAYVEQDAWFLTAFARAYALAIAKAPDLATMEELRALLEGVTDELRLHESYARQWGAQLDPEPSPATRAYTDFLQRVAWSEPVGHILAAMTPCMRLYAHLGTQLAPVAAPDTPYAEWIETYADEGFAQLTGRLEALLDAHDDGSTQIATNYRIAMECELAFFDQTSGAG